MTDSAKPSPGAVPPTAQQTASAATVRARCQQQLEALVKGMFDRLQDIVSDKYSTLRSAIGGAAAIAGLQCWPAQPRGRVASRLARSARGSPGAGEGTAAAPFLKIGTSSRAEAMGGAFTAVANDVDANYWNPAGLSQLRRSSVGFTHLEWFEGIRYEYLTYADKYDYSA